jgi:hypothetical protein
MIGTTCAGVGFFMHRFAAPRLIEWSGKFHDGIVRRRRSGCAGDLADFRLEIVRGVLCRSTRERIATAGSTLCLLCLTTLCSRGQRGAGPG